MIKVVGCRIKRLLDYTLYGWTELIPAEHDQQYALASGSETDTPSEDISAVLTGLTTRMSVLYCGLVQRIKAGGLSFVGIAA